MPDHESDEQPFGSSSGRRGDQPLRASSRPAFRGEQAASDHSAPEAGETAPRQGAAQRPVGAESHVNRREENPAQPLTRRERRRREAQEAERRAAEKARVKAEREARPAPRADAAAAGAGASGVARAGAAGAGSAPSGSAPARTGDAAGAARAAGIPAPARPEGTGAHGGGEDPGSERRPAPRHAARESNRRLHFDAVAPAERRSERPVAGPAGTREAATGGAAARAAGAGSAPGAAATTGAGSAAGAARASGAAAGAAGAGAAGTAAAGHATAADTSAPAGAAAAGTSVESTSAAGTSAGGFAAGTATGSASAAAVGSTARGAAASARRRDVHGERGIRHSKDRSDAFPAVVGWTSLGTLIPGLAMIRSGRSKKLGWFFLGFFLLGVLALVAVLLIKGPVKFAARFSTPQMLTMVAIALIVGALVWFFVILRSYAVMRRGHPFSAVQRVLGGVLVVSLLVIVGVPLGVGSAYAFVTGQTISKVFGKGDSGPVKDAAELWQDKPRVNVFLMGRDSSDTRQGTRPDTMLVASIDTHTGDATLFSIPRNLNHPLFKEGTKLAKEFPDGFNGGPGEEDSLINAVWDWTTENKQDVGDTHGLEKGMAATMQAVEGSTGLDIDYWASVNMKGFEDVLNAMGGVKIDVERPIPMGGGINQATGGKNSIFGWIDPGEQTLTGAKALWYVRSRDGSDNYDRMCRQQRMIKTALGQMNPQELALAYPKLAASATENVQTDIPQNQLQAFVELAGQMKGAKVKSAQINNQVTKTYRPDYTVLHSWVQEQINPSESSQKEDAQATTTASAKPTKSAAPTAAATTGAPAPGIEDADGKCYPTGYTPGSGWPGYPGNSSK